MCCKTGKDALKSIDWNAVPHPPYSPAIASSDHFFFWSMARSPFARAEMHIGYQPPTEKVVLRGIIFFILP